MDGVKRALNDRRMALLEQHSPSSPIFHNLHRFIDAISPTAPNTGLPLQGNPVVTADANQNCVTIVRHSFLFLACSLASIWNVWYSCNDRSVSRLRTPVKTSPAYLLSYNSLQNVWVLLLVLMVLLLLWCEAWDGWVDESQKQCAKLLNCYNRFSHSFL